MFKKHFIWVVPGQRKTCLHFGKDLDEILDDILVTKKTVVFQNVSRCRSALCECFQVKIYTKFASGEIRGQVQLHKFKKKCEKNHQQVNEIGWGVLTGPIFTFFTK